MADFGRARFPYGMRRSASGRRFGVWDHRRGGWAWEPRYGEQTARTICLAMLEGYSAGAADTVISKARAELAASKG